eukprot:scaffold52598_cov29-Prasinocladus_malaysianus.AAC.1
MSTTSSRTTCLVDCRKDFVDLLTNGFTTPFQVAMATGVVLDPVYSGKAVSMMIREMQDKPQEWTGRKVLFMHTGGLL